MQEILILLLSLNPELRRYPAILISRLVNNKYSLGELEKAVETLACWFVFPQHFSFFKTSICVSS